MEKVDCFAAIGSFGQLRLIDEKSTTAEPRNKYCLQFITTCRRREFV